MHRHLRLFGLVCSSALLVAARAEAQQAAAAPVVLTLARALDLAIPASEALTAAQASLRQADAQRRVARSGLFPQVSASASYLRTLETEFAGVFDRFPQDGATGGADLPFGRDNTYRLGVSASQRLYSGGRLGADRAVAEASAARAAGSVVTARGQTLLDTSQAYYDAALASRFVEIAEAALAQAESTLRQAELAFRAGTQPEFEVLRARVARDNQQPVVIRARLDRDLALLRLRQLIEVPAGAPLRLAANLDANPLPAPAPFAADLASVQAAAGASDTPREAVRQAEADVDRQRAALRRVRAERLPDVSLVSDYERVTYPTGIVSGFGDLRTNWTVGAFLRLSVLTGGRQGAQEAAARALVDAQQARLAQVEEVADLDARSADAALSGARAAWQASLAAVGEARRAYEIAEVRYRAGVSTQLELSDARLQLQQSGANRAQAARDLQMARVRCALLPQLPLSMPGSVPAPAIGSAGVGVSTPTGAGVTSPAAGAATGQGSASAAPGAAGRPPGGSS